MYTDQTKYALIYRKKNLQIYMLYYMCVWP